MAGTSLNFLTDYSGDEGDDDFYSLAANGEAWTAAIAGPRTTSTFFESLDGIIEYCLKPTATAPVVGFRGHRLNPGESQNFDSMSASQTLYLRAKTPNAEIAATPGDAS